MTTATYAPAASAVTAAPQLAPYGFFGDLAKTFAPVAGQAIGGLFGNSNVGGQIGNAVGHLAGFLPFSASPVVPPAVVQQQQLAQQQQQQQIAQQLAQHQIVQQQIAQQIAQQQLAQHQQQLAPYGFFGDLIKNIAPTAGQALGGVFGNSGLGGQIGNTVGQIASFLPFSASPAMPVPQPQQLIQPHLAPYGFFGDLIRNIAPTAGQALGGVFGNSGLGGQIGGAVGQIASFLPFSAGPTVPQQLVQQPQLAPYGIFGGALGNVLGGLGGGALGDLFGNKQLGQTIGTTAGTILGSILPFSAQPMVPYAHTPYIQYAN